jgi:hexokinase
VGLIVGTGSNVGAYLPMAVLRKLSSPGWPSDLMAVNFESGAFSPPGLGPADEDVDRASTNPGAQRFEKAVSGAYLGRVFSAAAARMGIGIPGAVESSEVSRLAAEERGSAAGALARAVIDRSADLVAAALAATGDVIGGEGPLSVHAEGSLIRKGPGYAERVRSTLDRMRVPAAITFGDDANLIGSALAALSR